MLHMTYNTVRSGTNTTVGSGSNTLTTAPATYSNTIAKNYKNNICASTNLLLAGLTSTTTLVSAVSTYSDGYRATLSVGLEFFNAGATGGWRGACIVLYSA